MADIKEIVNEREGTHGDFSDTSFRAQALKTAIRAGSNYNKLTCAQREALDMMCSKLSRILEGSPNVIDHWADLGGYAECVVRYLERSDENA